MVGWFYGCVLCRTGVRTTLRTRVREWKTEKKSYYTHTHTYIHIYVYKIGKLHKGFNTLVQPPPIRYCGMKLVAKYFYLFSSFFFCYSLFWTVQIRWKRDGWFMKVVWNPICEVTKHPTVVKNESYITQAAAQCVIEPIRETIRRRNNTQHCSKAVVEHEVVLW